MGWFREMRGLLAQYRQARLDERVAMRELNRQVEKLRISIESRGSYSFDDD